MVQIKSFLDEKIAQATPMSVITKFTPAILKTHPLFLHRTMSATLPSFTCSFKPTLSPASRTRPTTIIASQRTPPPARRTPKPVPARDRVVDFGKHKGKMLGALPSSYLKWVSSNLRAGDFEEWARLADQVLADPVYQDRIEWEFADSVLTGGGGGRSLASSAAAGEDGAVARLLEISERFGWDNEDKAGWSKVRFELLGTSFGGRIPRVKREIQGPAGAGQDTYKKEEEEEGEVVEVGERARRKERRERRKGRRGGEVREGKLGFLLEGRGSLGNVKERKDMGGAGGDKGDNERARPEISSNNDNYSRRFPGREGLIRQALNRRRFSS